MGAPPGADRRHRPGLRPARDADLAAAGEADRDRADVPLRPAAGRPLPPVLAVRRRGDRRPGPGRRRRDHRARRALLPRGRPRRRRGPPQLDRRPGLPAGLRRGADRRTSAATRDALPALERDRLERNVAAPARLEGPGDGGAQRRRRRGSPTGCATACAAHFAAVRAHLDALGVPYRLEPGLVRGLDYYTRTAFEFYVAGREGQQQALGGGGRYDGLVELLGGRPTPGHRVRDRPRPGRPRARGDRASPRRPSRRRSRSSSAPTRTTRSARLAVATDLRAAGLAARAELGARKLGKQLEAAARDGAHFAVILGDELAAGEVQLRDLPAGTQKLVARRRPGPRAASARTTAPHRHGRVDLLHPSAARRLRGHDDAMRKRRSGASTSSGSSGRWPTAR